MEIRAIKATGLIKEIEIEYIIVKRCMGIDIRKIDRKKVKVDIDLSKINDLTSYDIFLPRKFIGERLDDFLMHDSCDLSQQFFRELIYIVYGVLSEDGILEYLTGIVNLAEDEEIIISFITIKKLSDIRIIEGENLTILAADVSVTREKSKLPNDNFAYYGLDITTIIDDKDELVDTLKRSYLSHIVNTSEYSSKYF